MTTVGRKSASERRWSEIGYEAPVADHLMDTLERELLRTRDDRGQACLGHGLVMDRPWFGHDGTEALTRTALVRMMSHLGNGGLVRALPARCCIRAAGLNQHGDPKRWRRDRLARA